MRKYLLAAAAVAAIATPAMARDGAGYVGIEGGVLFPRDSSYDVTVSNIPTGTAATARTTTTFNNGFEYEYKRGYDIDAVAGYDFGMFRLEGELGYKRARRDNFTPSAGLITGINTGITFTNPGNAGINVNQFNGFRRTDVQSAMVNALVDFGSDPGVNFFAGAGIGGARVRTMGDRDRALAWQLIAGARTAISPNVDLGLKYRYFQTRRLNFTNTQTFGLANIYGFNSEGKFRSHSLLASLIFNFGGVEAAPPPPPVEAAPPPPPPPPPTQTCPDGSVIDATASCPVPPPPPPPPAQGERG